MHSNGGFSGKIIKIGTNEVKDILNDLRYSAKLDFFPEGNKLKNPRWPPKYL